MSALGVDELRDELEAGRIRPAYLLAGEEALLRDDALAALRRAALEGAPEEFDLDRLDGDQTEEARLRDALRVLPVLAPRRLVVLREPEPRRARSGGLAAALPDMLAEVCQQEATVLVVTAGRVDRRSRWVKAFSDPAVEVSCDPPRAGRALLGFVREEAQRQRVELTEEAAELLAERVGPQLLALRQEIAKASLLAGAGAAVTRDVAAASTSVVAEQPIWDLTDAIGEGRPGRAVSVLARVLASGAAPPMVLGALASHFRRLCRVRSGAGVSGPPFVRRKLEAQARRYAPARLVACLRAIHETDLALKGAAALPADLALERLVLGLVS